MRMIRAATSYTDEIVDETVAPITLNTYEYSSYTTLPNYRVPKKGKNK